jgi:alpha-1,6-mannosyltransferase
MPSAHGRLSTSFDPRSPWPHLVDASAFWNPSGGVHRVLSARHAMLPGLGWRHTVLAPGAQGSGHVDCGGLHLPGTGGYSLPLGRHRLARRIETLAPDLIEVADPYTLAWATLDAGARLDVPTVAFCHSNLPAMAARLLGGAQGLRTRRGVWAARRARQYLADLYSRFDLVLAPSGTMVRRLRQWGVQQAQHQPLGVDCDTFSPQAADPVLRRRIVRHLGVSSDTRLLLYTGRFAPEKNLDVLADAVDLLGPGHLLVAVGAGPRPPCGRRVRVLPPVTQARHLARLLANGDVYVHAGDQETFGLGALEAMACGLPVVLSAADGLGELAARGGLAVAGRNPRDWADTLAFALSASLDTLCAQALAHARAHDWRLVVQQMAQRYQDAVEQAKLPRPPAQPAVPAPPPQRLGGWQAAGGPGGRSSA